jgi:glycerate 2-kinase
MLYALDPYIATKRLIGLHGEILTVGHLHFNLCQRGNIYVLGAGKATFAIAKALEEILGKRIVESLIVVKNGQDGILEKINTYLIAAQLNNSPF